MKILILALDALEYDLVEKWDLKNLKQKEYGKVILPIKPGEEPATPAMWLSFITGKEPELHNVTLRVKWKNPIIDYFSKKFGRLSEGKKRKDERVHFFWPGKLLRLLGFKKKMIDRGDIKFSTIFDETKSIAISVPSYNEDKINYEIVKDMMNALGKDASIPKQIVEDKIRIAFLKRKRRLINAIRGDWELLMTHFFILDIIQHTFFYDQKKIRKYYEEIDSIIGKIKKKLPNNVLILIVSDHGQKRGIHTDYGFYSLNKKLCLKNPKMTEFKDIIERCIKESK
jgi:predicted AlkP superfamily phosphohydrolase/phosphomutase